MTTIQVTPWLRNVLSADAASSAMAGLLMLLGADALSGPLGLPPVLLTGAGVVLLPFAAAVFALARRTRLPRAAVWAVIAANAAWAVESAMLLLAGWIAPTGLGVAFVLAMALVVLAFAEVEYLCVRRATAA